MKVLLLGNLQSVHVRRWAQELERRGVATLCASFAAPPEAFSTRFVVMPSRFPFNLWAARRQVRELIVREKPDLVHAHYLGSYGLLAALVGFAPTVMSAWGSDLLVTAQKTALHRRLMQRILRRASIVFADSQELLQVAQKLHGADLKTEYVLWGLEETRLQSPRSFANSRARHFVSLRMHEPPYNLERLLIAFQKAGLEGARLTLAGSGSQTARLKNLAHQLNLNVSFPGLLSEPQVSDLLREADVSVSIPQSDGTAMSVLEAMAAGLPMVVSDLPANREWLDESGAVFVSPERVDSLAEALRAFYSGDMDIKAMGSRNHLVVKERARRQTHFDRVRAVYEQLVAPS